MTFASVDCVLSQWMPWSPCEKCYKKADAKAAQKKKKFRFRQVETSPAFGGEDCKKADGSGILIN